MPWSFCVSFSCKKKKMKSTCSKGKCQVDEKKPIMIVLAAGTASSSKWKALTHIANSGSDIDESADLEESNSDPYEMEDESESESSNIYKDPDPIKVLRATWKPLSPPVAEESVWMVCCSAQYETCWSTASEQNHEAFLAWWKWPCWFS